MYVHPILRRQDAPFDLIVVEEEHVALIVNAAIAVVATLFRLQSIGFRLRLCSGISNGYLSRIAPAKLKRAGLDSLLSPQRQFD